MTDRMQKQAMQKMMDYTKANPQAKNQEQYPTSMNAQAQENAEKEQQRQYFQYCKNYYGGYGMTSIKGPEGQQPSNYPGSNVPKSSGATENDGKNSRNTMGSSMYQMGMQPSSHYPYGYPYSYYHPSMQYPYGYNPYYRPYSDMYMQQATAQGQASNPSYGNPSFSYPWPYPQAESRPNHQPKKYQAPSEPTPQHQPAQKFQQSQPNPQENIHWSRQSAQPQPQPAELPVVKQEIIISSDEERQDLRNEQRQNKEMLKKRGQAQLQTKVKAVSDIIEEKAGLEMEKLVGQQAYKLQQISKATKQLEKATTKSKKIFKDKDKDYVTSKQVRENKAERKRQYAIRDNDDPKGPKDDKNINEKIAASLKHFESKQMFAKSVSAKMQVELQHQFSIAEREEKNNSHMKDEKDNSKKEKLKDDHPLKELRYSQSHGKIRSGQCYQSSIPDLLPSNRISILKLRLHNQLQERQISAITF